MNDSCHSSAHALIAFEDRFHGELISQWQKLEQEMASAIISAPVMEKYQPFQKFFDGAEDVVAETMHEYFQRLLDVAAKGSAESLGNESPLDWTKRHVLMEVCEFLAIDPKLVEWAGSQNPQCGMSWRADSGFDPTSESKEDSLVLRSAMQLTGTGLENEESSEFLLPCWTETCHPAWSLRSPDESPEAISPRNEDFERKRMSRAETMQWVKNTEFRFSMKIARQIHCDALDGLIKAGGTGISILEPFTSSSTNEREQFIRPLLEAKGWSVGDWALHSDVDRHTADNYLKGRGTFAHTRKKLAESLGMHVDELPQ